MTYHYRAGVIVPFAQKYYKQLILAVAAIFMSSMAMMSIMANAALPAYTWEFTQTELDNNWAADRTFPTGGVTSVSAHGRDDVAQLSFDSGAANATQFYRTEGIQTVGDFGDAVKADLYIDSNWSSISTRSGLWADGKVGNEAHADGPWGIIEFTSNNNGFTGWRAWASDIGWTNLPAVTFAYDEWVTLQIDLDEANQNYEYYVNDVLVHVANAEPSTSGLVDHFGTVILNSYNYGQEGGVDYMAHWNGGLLVVDEEAPTVPVALGATTPVVPCGGITDSFNVTLGWTESTDNVGVVGYEYNVVTPNGTDWTTTVGGTSYSGAFNDGEGAYTYQVRAFDAEGNFSEWSNLCAVSYDDPATAEVLGAKDECKNGGWMTDDRGFKNQGDCVSFFATKEKNPPAGSTTTSNARRR